MESTPCAQHGERCAPTGARGHARARTSAQKLQPQAPLELASAVRHGGMSRSTAKLSDTLFGNGGGFSLVDAAPTGHVGPALLDAGQRGGPSRLPVAARAVRKAAARGARDPGGWHFPSRHGRTRITSHECAGGHGTRARAPPGHAAPGAQRAWRRWNAKCKEEGRPAWCLERDLRRAKADLRL